MKDKVTIIGAGIAGLSAALKLKLAGIPYEIFEKNNEVGGLLRNFTIDGFRFDHAVHLSFATEPEVRDIFDKTEYHSLHPESKCFEEDKWLRHPVQNNLYPLSTPTKVDLIKSFIERPSDKLIENYADWLNYQYGYEIANRYPVRYTKKYWDISPENLGINWIGNRMHRATIEEILMGAMTESVPNYYYAKEMRYPKKGGYISFLSPIINEIKVQTNKSMSELDLERKHLTFEDGSIYKYEKLVNTSPLPFFIKKIKNCPEEIIDLSNSLSWTKVHLVSFGFNKPSLVKDLWFYIYDEDIYASRAYSPSLKAQENCPPGCSSIQFEIYQGNFSERIYSKSELIENCLYAIKKMNIATKSDVVVTDCRVIEYGNVIFHKGMEEKRNKIIDWLTSKDLVMAGRFGEWDYLWSNQAMVSGFKAAERFL